MKRGGAKPASSNVVRLAPKAGGPARDIAVIDVGSNSVRLVVYRVDGRDFTPILNDRAPAGLGRDLASTGKLSPDGVGSALAAARRFRLFLDARKVKEVRVVGTAAVREASDAPAFVAEVERALGAKVQVLSGEEEGRYAALGVLAGDPQAHGVIADLGGSSLELASVGGGEAGRPATFPLGSFALAVKSGGDVKAVRKLIDEALDSLTFTPPTDGALYIVGGAWRNFARIAMVHEDYPLRFLQGFEMTATEASNVARFLSKQSAASISRMPEVSRRRAEAMPFAAAALDRLIRRLKLPRIITSAYGLREGVLLEAMPAPMRRADPMLAGVEAMARRAGADVAFGRAVETWIAPLEPLLLGSWADVRSDKLLLTACRLADIGVALHPDHRAELAAQRVLYAQFAGATHFCRVLLSKIVHHRYAGRREPVNVQVFDRILTPEARDAAVRIGLALRLAGSISSRSAPLLAESRLEFDGEALKLILSRRGADLATDVVEKRLAQLADAVGHPATITVE